MSAYDHDWDFLKQLSDAFEDYWEREASNRKGILVFAAQREFELPEFEKTKRRRVAERMMASRTQPDCLKELLVYLRTDSPWPIDKVQALAVEILRMAKRICDDKPHRGSWMRFFIDRPNTKPT